MDDLKVPTITVEAELRYFDERLLKGRIFLPVGTATRESPMYPEEWINQANFFFPFLVDGEERARILNKRYVVVLTIRASEHAEVWAEPIGVVRNVRIECGTLQIRGTVYIDMPNYMQRLLDFANRPEAFLVVYEGEKRHIVQKSRITFLAEA
jgi:hypothetical protein